MGHVFPLCLHPCSLSGACVARADLPGRRVGTVVGCQIEALAAPTAPTQGSHRAGSCTAKPNSIRCAICWTTCANTSRPSGPACKICGCLLTTTWPSRISAWSKFSKKCLEPFVAPRGGQLLPLHLAQTGSLPLFGFGSHCLWSTLLSVRRNE